MTGSVGATQIATPPTCYRSLSGPSGPSGPKCPGSVPELGCPRKRGCPRECPKGCPQRAPGSGVSKKCPSRSVKKVSGTLWGHSRDTFWTLRSPGPKGLQGTPSDTASDTPVFGDTLGDTLGTLRARSARETPVARRGGYNLGCRKWGFKRWGFKEIRGYLRKKAFFLRFLDFPGALGTLRKRAKKAEKGRFWPILADFQEGRPDTP